MIKLRKGISIVGLFLIFIMACEQDDCIDSPDVSDVKVQFELNDYTDDLIQADENGELRAFLNKQPFIANYFFEKDRFKNDSILIDQLLNVFQHPSYKDTLYQEMRSEFGDFSELKNEYRQAFTHYKYYYPAAQLPRIQTVITGLKRDLYVSDSLISIAADYFVGPDATYVPQGIPNYILRRYQPEYVVPMTMLLYTQKHNKTSVEDNSLLADMVFYGKSYYMNKHLMPCTPDSLLIGFTAKEMTGVRENEAIIWANFIENDLLYETSPFLKNKFIGERPKTYEISNQCPGRIGLWVGWQIVKSYMEKNPDVSLQSLMENTNAREIFQKSSYKPSS